MSKRKKEILEVLNRFPDVEDNTVLLDGKSHLAMEAADAILVASGTATLEAALYKKPLVVGYAMPALSGGADSFQGDKVDRACPISWRRRLWFPSAFRCSVAETSTVSFASRPGAEAAGISQRSIFRNA